MAKTSRLKKKYRPTKKKSRAKQKIESDSSYSSEDGGREVNEDGGGEARRGNSKNSSPVCNHDNDSRSACDDVLDVGSKGETEADVSLLSDVLSVNNDSSPSKLPHFNRNIPSEFCLAPEGDEGGEGRNSSDDGADIDSGAALSARRAKFYQEIDKKIYALEKDHKTTHIMTDDLFNDVFQFMTSIKNAPEADRLSIMKNVPNKMAYKWIKKYEILMVETSNILIYKQAEGDALDSAQKVVHYSKMFDVLRDVHELQAGNDHPKSRTLYRRVCARYGKSIPRWVCELFPLYCPVCVRSKPRKKPKAGHQPLLTRGMNVRAQIDLIDYQSMPDGPYNYVLDYQDHGIKFCQLRPLTKKSHRAIALELLNIFCIFGPPSILQADNGKEFTHGASKSRHVQFDDELTLIMHAYLQYMHLSECFDMFPN